MLEPSCSLHCQGIPSRVSTCRLMPTCCSLSLPACEDTFGTCKHRLRSLVGALLYTGNSWRHCERVCVGCMIFAAWGIQTGGSRLSSKGHLPSGRAGEVRVGGVGVRADPKLNRRCVSKGLVSWLLALQEAPNFLSRHRVLPRRRCRACMLGCMDMHGKQLARR